MLIFLIFRAEAYTCWSARFARSRVGGVARLFKEISVFFGFWYFFSFRVFWSFWSFEVFHHEPDSSLKITSKTVFSLK